MVKAKEVRESAIFGHCAWPSSLLGYRIHEILQQVRPVWQLTTERMADQGFNFCLQDKFGFSYLQYQLSSIYAHLTTDNWNRLQNAEREKKTV